MTQLARLRTGSTEEITVEVTDPLGSRILWYRSREVTWRTPPPTLDFAAVALAHHAAYEAQDLHLDGPVSRAQLDNLDELLRIWSSWRPDLFRHVEITAAEEVDDPVTEGRGGAVMGYSGGVDASFALVAHSEGLMGRQSRAVDLGVLVIGWDVRHGDEPGRERAAASARRSLAAYGVDTAVVATNWKDDFCPAWFMSFMTGLTSVLHTFSGTASAMVVANDQTYRRELGIHPYGCHTMTNPLLGSPFFPVVTTGGTHSRLERVAALKGHHALLADLRVCYQLGSAGGNCGKCEKCARTQLELHACGIPSDGLFAQPLTTSDLEAARPLKGSVILHYEDVLERLAPDDPWRAPLAEWVRSRRT